MSSYSSRAEIRPETNTLSTFVLESTLGQLRFDMKLVVIGGNGLIGKALVYKLRSGVAHHVALSVVIGSTRFGDWLRTLRAAA